MNRERPTFIIAGTGVPGRMVGDLAYGVQRLWWNCEVVTIPGLGLLPLDESYAELEHELSRRMERYDTLGQFVGHSQGGYHAIRFGLDHPELAAFAASWYTPWSGLDGTVDSVRGVLLGVLQRLAGGRLDQVAGDAWHLGEREVEALLRQLAPGLHSLVYMGREVHDLRFRVESGHPDSLKLALISGSGDRFVRPRRSALDLEAPGQGALSKYYFGHRRPASLPPDVQFVRGWLTGHITSMLSLRLLNRALNPQTAPLGRSAAAA